ncbi:MAG: PLDc N-terminal domain-containing protein [Rhodohalobacter sp.]|uniref:PLDc N-terminal domain-containing protein n=1 Tax=Rhodohalobacter sp. TaxID=1974210 RepID=UPI003976E716
MEFLAYIVGFICAIYVIVEVWSKQPGMGTGEKVLWTIAALFFNILTAIIYFFAKKN